MKLTQEQEKRLEAAKLRHPSCAPDVCQWSFLLSIIDQLSADEKWESADDVPVDGIYQVIGTAPFNGSAWTTVYVTHWRSLPPPSPAAKGAEA